MTDDQELPYDVGRALAALAEWENLAEALDEMAETLEEQADNHRQRACDVEVRALKLRERLIADGVRIDGSGGDE